MFTILVHKILGKVPTQLVVAMTLIKHPDQTIFMSQLGKRIKDLRIKAGYNSQEFFAYASGIPRAQYARYEKGSNITVVSLLKIIQFHKITFQEFFSEGFDF